MLAGSEIREAHREGDERGAGPVLHPLPAPGGRRLPGLACARPERPLEVEANAATDNPLVLGPEGPIVSGGNFHAEPVAFAGARWRWALAELGSIAERRIATLVDPAR